jgi:hypothetical protein
LVVVSATDSAKRLAENNEARRYAAYIEYSFLPSVVWAELWYARSLATRSVASWAALTASILGMMRRASANSAMASCSREPLKV